VDSAKDLIVIRTHQVLEKILTCGEAGERYPLVGEGDDVGELADEVGGKLGPLDGGFNLAADLPLSGQTFRQVLLRKSHSKSAHTKVGKMLSLSLGSSKFPNFGTLA